MCVVDCCIAPLNHKIPELTKSLPSALHRVTQHLMKDCKRQGTKSPPKPVYEINPYQNVGSPITPIWLSFSKLQPGHNMALEHRKTSPLQQSRHPSNCVSVHHPRDNTTRSLEVKHLRMLQGIKDSLAPRYTADPREADTLANLCHILDA